MVAYLAARVQRRVDRSLGRPGPDGGTPAVGADPTRRQCLRRVSATASGTGAALSPASGSATADDRGDRPVGTCDDLQRGSLAALPWDERDLADTGRSAAKEYGGWTAAEHFDGPDWDLDPGAAMSGRTPIVYVHGNTGDACHFEEHAAHMLVGGWAGHDLYAITFAGETTPHGEMADQLEDFVADVRHHLEDTHGYTGDLAFVSHSLGVTGVRWWAHTHYVTENEEPPMDTFVGMSGPNHGVPACDITCWLNDCRDWSESVYNGLAGWLDPGEVCQTIGEDCTDETDSKLHAMNDTAGETPTAASYYTIRSPQDRLFTTLGCGYDPNSPRLAGAETNYEYGYFDHVDHSDMLRGNNFASCSSDCSPEPPALVEWWLSG